MPSIWAYSAGFLAMTHDQATTIVKACLWLMGFILVASVAAAIVRRRLRRSQDESPIPFTLDDLRQMNQRGDLTDEEYQRARASLIERMKLLQSKSQETANPPKKGPV